MIQVEALERLKSGEHNLHTGDRVTVDDALAKRWCSFGWAKAVNGEIETGERRVVKAVLEPAKASHKTISSEVNANG